jgi:hypothetical protein
MDIKNCVIKIIHEHNQSAADFRGCFRLKGKSCKKFDVMVSTKICFFKFSYGGCSPGAPSPPPVGAGLFGFHNKQRISWLFKILKDVSARKR